MKPIAAVTGATGLVGSALVRRLVSSGFQVRALVRNANGPYAWPGDADVSLVSGSLADAGALRLLCKDARYVFNAAAHVSDWGSRAEFWRVNCEGVALLCEAAWQAHPERFVHVSTVDVFGFSRHTRIDESCPRIGYAHDYSASKLAGEQVVWQYQERGMPSSVLYPTWVFGAGDRHFIPAVVGMLRDGRVPNIDGGAPHLEMTYSENLSGAALLVAQSPEAAGQGYIVGDGYEVNLGGLFTAVADRISAHRPKGNVPYPALHAAAALTEGAYRLFRPGRRPPLTRYAVRTLANGSRYDISKLRRLGYQPRVAFTSALDETLASMAG